MDLMFRATHKYARIAPRKARYVMDMIRHKRVNEALEILQFSNRRAARFIERVLKSAIANAGEESLRRKIDLDANSLVVSEALIEEGPTFKRFRPRSRGMANPILKRNSHIVIGLVPLDDEAAKPERPARKAKKKASAGADEGAKAEEKAEASTATAVADEPTPDTADDAKAADADAAADSDESNSDKS